MVKDRFQYCESVSKKRKQDFERLFSYMAKKLQNWARYICQIL